MTYGLLKHRVNVEWWTKQTPMDPKGAAMDSYRHADARTAVNGTGNGNLRRMSTSIHRRHRGTGLGNVTLKVDIAPDAKALVERVAQHMGLSQAQAAERLLMCIPLDARDLPRWSDIDNYQTEGVLPIPKAG